MRWARPIVAFGLLAYLASFFFLAPTPQKTLFYLLIAAPSIILLSDLRQLLLQKRYRTPTLFVLCFIAYFALSSLWSSEGTLGNGLKLAFCILCLLVAVHSTMNMCGESGTWIRYFILAVGSCATCLYAFLFIEKMFLATEYAIEASRRYSLSILSGWGDSNPINTAMYFGLLPLTAWWSFPQSRPQIKIGLLILTTISVAIMFLSQSRGPILSLAVTLLLISIFRWSKDDLILWGVLLSSGLMAILIFNLAPLIVDRAYSPNYRTEIWMNAIQLIKDNLFFGQGLGDSAGIPLPTDTQNRVTVTHSHSSILDTFRVGGLVGGVLFLAMLLSITCRPLAKNEERPFFVFWLIFGLLCLSTNGRALLIRPSIEWFAFWLPLFFVLFSPAETGAKKGAQYC
ncbi:O-antigen ligase family protein [Propionivibrio sp.]|uniref:O-antigen ligase family protein n=1 Tax=Propionivibrio sp. TaxID=2212460 RepID=UPI0039E35643